MTEEPQLHYSEGKESATRYSNHDSTYLAFEVDSRRAVEVRFIVCLLHRCCWLVAHHVGASVEESVPFGTRVNRRVNDFTMADMQTFFDFVAGDGNACG